MSAPATAKGGGDALGQLTGELRRRIEATGAGEAFDAEAALAELRRLEKLASLLRDTALHSFGEFEQRVQELSLVRGIGELFASVFDLDRMCKELLRLLDDTLRSSYGFLYLYEFNDDRLELVASIGPEIREEDRELTARVARLALRGSDTIRIADVGQCTELVAAKGASVLASLLACPLLSQGETLGVIAIGEPEPRRLAEECERLLRPIADLAAMAIRNARLCESHLAHQRDLETMVEQRTREVNEARTALSRQERAEAMGKLAAGIAHEVNNPMSFLISNLERAAEYAGGLQSGLPVLLDWAEVARSLPNSDDPRVERAREAAADAESAAVHQQMKAMAEDLGELIQETREGADRIRRVGEDLRSFAHSVAGMREAADLNQLVETALHIVPAEAGDRLTFERCFGVLPKIRCQRYQITQLLLNLLQNAVEAIAGHGSVRITTRSSDRWIEVEISDDGPGLTTEQLDRIFEPFYTTKETGRGLGLSIARDIAVAHQGTLAATATRRGGVFTLQLPVGAPGNPRLQDPWRTSRD